MSMRGRAEIIDVADVIRLIVKEVFEERQFHIRHDGQIVEAHPRRSCNLSIPSAVTGTHYGMTWYASEPSDNRVETDSESWPPQRRHQGRPDQTGLPIFISGTSATSDAKVNPQGRPLPRPSGRRGRGNREGDPGTPPRHSQPGRPSAGHPVAAVTVVRRGREATRFRRIRLKRPRVLARVGRKAGKTGHPGFVLRHRNYRGRPEGDQPMPEAGMG